MFGVFFPHKHKLTSLSKSAWMCVGLYLGFGAASKYLFFSVFHCSSDQKHWRPLGWAEIIQRNKDPRNNSKAKT